MSSAADAAAATAAHTMMFQDAAWAADVVYSAHRDRNRDLAALLSTLLIGQWARIIYEGSQALHSNNPQVAVPVLANLLEREHAAVLARARHSIKLFDDTKKGYEHVLADVTAHHDAHRARFTGKAVRFARWLETDLGLTLLDAKVVGTTISAHIHMGQPVTAIADDHAMGTAILAASTEQGAALAVLLGLGGQFEPRPTLDLAALRPMRTVDRDADRYLSRRYDHHYPTALKLLLLGIEADLSTCELVLPVLERGHEDAVFRARVVTVFHALRAVQEISARHPDRKGATSPVLAGILVNSAVQRLATPGAKAVRNRCVHYEIRGPVKAQLRPGERMHGIVEAVTGRGFDDFDNDVTMATRLVTAILRSWTA